jgi:hypothetical protein
MSAPTRRALLAGTSAAILATCGAAAACTVHASEDARLIALGADLQRNSDARLAMAARPHGDEEYNALHDAFWTIAEEIQEITPTTPIGHAAKARAALLAMDDCGDLVPLATRTLYDVAGLPMPAPKPEPVWECAPEPVPPSDAALIAACSAFPAVHAELRRVVATGDDLAHGSLECKHQEAEVARLADAVDRAIAEVDDMPARTVAGLLAKARFLINLPEETDHATAADLGCTLAVDMCRFITGVA